MMKPLERCTFLLALLIFPFFAWGAGTCPTSASYLNPTNPAGALVSLAATGITNGCYFFAANGSDSNDGLSEAAGHPQQHLPGMPNYTGSIVPSAGVGFIVRGGDTWHFGNSGARPYTGGSWSWSWTGSSSHPIYVGVDQTWYSAGSWVRPTLTWDNPPTSSQTLSSCTYPSGDMLDTGGVAFDIFDNFEMTGICTTSAHWNAIYVSYNETNGFMGFYNLYIHGWSHVGFPNPNNCTTNSTCMSAFRGFTTGGNYPPGEEILYDIVDGSDSDPVPMEFCYCGAWYVGDSYFNRGSQFITRTQHIVHDNVITNFVSNGHSNVMESVGDSASPANAEAVYNNVFSHLYVGDAFTTDVGFWPIPPVGATLYWFNNLAYDIAPCEFFNGPNSANQGTIARFNDTFQMNTGGGNQISCGVSPYTAPYTDANLHFISSDVSSIYQPYCSGQGANATSLLMTNAAATADGYTSSQSYAFSPTSGSSPTVGVGTNETSSFCAALSIAARADTYLSDAATKCNSDTSYAISYNASTHTVSYPARTSNARPASGAWNIGDYEFGAPGVPSITSPLTATCSVSLGCTYQTAATNSPTSFSASGLPGTLTLNTSTGLISGTPTVPTTYTITLGATNVSGTGNATLTLTVWYFVQQSAGITCNSTATCAVSLPGSTAPGTLLMLAFAFPTGPTVTSIADTQGNTFLPVGSALTSPGSDQTQLYLARNIAGGAESATITLSGSAAFVIPFLTNYSGLNQTSPIDGTPAGATGSAGAVSSGSMTGSFGNDMVYGFCWGDASCSVGSGFNARSTYDSNLIEDRIQPSPGSFAATATATGGWTMQGVLLRPLGAIPNAPTEIRIGLVGP